MPPEKSPIDNGKLETANPQDLANRIVETVADNLDAADAVKPPESTPEPSPESTPEPSTESKPPAVTKTTVTSETRPAWHSEPLSNFETDDAGNLKLDDKGEPIRRGGRPRKAHNLKIGEKLAGGGVYQGRAAAVKPGTTARPSPSIVKTPQTPGSGANQAATEPDGQAPSVAGPGPSGEFGADAGEVVIDAVRNLITAKNPNAQPTPN